MIIGEHGELVTQVAYKNEDEFQAIVFTHPELIGRDDVVSIGREVTTGAGPIDVLLASRTGDIVVVETKLWNNPESRRKVVAQTIDYISSLSEYSYHELDDFTKNRLSNFVDSLKTEINLPKTIDNNLRHGRVHLVIAVDNSNNDLQRIVQFLAGHSDFNLSLVEIQKHQKGDEVFYSSNTIIESKDKDFQSRANESIETAFSMWNETHEKYPATGSARTFRQIKMPKWMSNVHYEFFSSNEKKLSIRLDNEINAASEDCAKVSKILAQFDGHKIADNFTIKAVYNADKNKVMRIEVEIDNKDIEESAVIMEELINLTKPSIDEFFRN